MDPSDKLDELLRNLYGMSHIIAWAIFLPGSLLVVLIKCCLTCNDEYTYNQSRLIQKYQQAEDEIMAKRIEKLAEQHAAANIGFFFSEPRFGFSTASLGYHGSTYR